MTEVRRGEASSGGAGLFATKEFAIGDAILREEKPLLRLAPATQQEEKAIIDELVPSSCRKGQLKDPTNKESSPGLLNLIGTSTSKLESTSSSSVVKVDEDKFRAMIQAALCFIHQKPTDQQITALLELYHPKLEPEVAASRNEPEQALVRLSEQAITHLETLAAKEPGSPLHSALSAPQTDQSLLGKSTLQKVMLIWACNAFQGGRIYPTISRINHSCDPDTVVVLVGDNNNNNGEEDLQTIRAAAPIRAGDEITISYLGTVLYADKETRRAALRRDKAFDCACERCIRKPDKAFSIPCPSCHPRVLPGKRQLEEDVQYDDEQTVHYVCPTPEVLEDGKTAACFRCDACNFCFGSNDEESKNPEFQRLLKTSQSVVDRVVVFLKEYEARNSTSKESGNDDDEDDEANLVHIGNLEQRLQMASSVLGARHWATNIMLLLQLDHTLQSYHARLLTEASSSGDKQDDDTEEAAMETIAEAIDMLERICRFVDGLELKLHKGHLLSDVIIGTARALVSLGDVKSQKYAAEWLEKLDGYVDMFASEGMKKVVETLKNAWQRTEEESNRPEKRAKR